MLEKIKKIREMTGAGVVDVKKALEESRGDEKVAVEILRKKGKQKADKKLERSASEGLVASYVHSNQKVGAMVKLFCESDFVARNPEFQSLAMDIAMHVTAMNPRVVRPEEVSSEAVEKEKEIWRSQLKEEGKPEEMLDKIMEGKEKRFREDSALLTQPFVKDPQKTVGELVTEKIAKIGENIQVGEFYRMEL